MKPTKDEVARQFDRMSHAYASSAGHAHGDDLAIVMDFLAPMPDMRVLDVATGAGHTAAAAAPSVREVVAVDIAPAMLARTIELAAARGLANVTTVLTDVECLAFGERSFDAVTCRIAPHHFLDVDRALAQIARVLRPGGSFVVEDSVVPEDRQLDEFLNSIEKLRDATHVRSLTAVEWTSKLLRAGMKPVRTALYRKKIDVVEWIARAGLDDAGADRVYAQFALAPQSAVDYFAIEYFDGKATAYTDDKIIIRAEKHQR